MPAPVECAYAAGFFDGEGSVSICYGSSLPTIRVSVAQNDLEPLERIKKEFGGEIYPAVRGNNHLEWNKAEEVIFFLESILPYSSRRKDKVNLAIEIAKLIGKKDLGSKVLRLRLVEKFEEVHVA